MKVRLLLPALAVASAAIASAATPDSGYTLHEWGTFTCVQGSDGVQMDWNPRIAPELPWFVYERSHVAASAAATGAAKARVKGVVVAGKTGTAQRQRMETPVMYFYSDQPRTVDVAVRFPHGAITEWYPQKSAAFITPSFAPDTGEPVLHWSRIDILGRSDAAKGDLLTDATGSHYYAARETDASLLRVWDLNQTNELEKFLFYRGLAAITTPLHAKLESSDPKQVALSNGGKEDLRDIFVYEVRDDGTLSWWSLTPLAPGAAAALDMRAGAETGAASLASALRRALVGQGLYEKEAAAMVKTWESAWFGERGLRALYLLPRAWTDRTLPLDITPAPQEVQRVMVARAEIITSAMETALRDQVERYAAAQPPDQPALVAATRALGFGRFIPCVQRRLTRDPDWTKKFGPAAAELIQVVMQPEPGSTSAAGYISP
jgi:hypothetical protein